MHTLRIDGQKMKAIGNALRLARVIKLSKYRNKKLQFSNKYHCKLQKMLRNFCSVPTISYEVALSLSISEKKTVVRKNFLKTDSDSFSYGSLSKQSFSWKLLSKYLRFKNCEHLSTDSQKMTAVKILVSVATASIGGGDNPLGRRNNAKDQRIFQIKI